MPGLNLRSVWKSFCETTSGIMHVLELRTYKAPLTEEEKAAKKAASKKRKKKVKSEEDDSDASRTFRKNHVGGYE